MATVDKTIGEGTRFPESGRPIRVIRKRIDLSVDLPGNADVHQHVDVPAGFFCIGTAIDVKRVEGATLTCHVGDGSDADGFQASVDLNTLGVSKTTLALTEGTPNTITGYFAGKLYAAADTIDITYNNASGDVAVFDFYVYGFELSVGPAV